MFIVTRVDLLNFLKLNVVLWLWVGIFRFELLRCAFGVRLSCSDCLYWLVDVGSVLGSGGIVFCFIDSGLLLMDGLLLLVCLLDFVSCGLVFVGFVLPFCLLFVFIRLCLLINCCFSS